MLDVGLWPSICRSAQLLLALPVARLRTTGLVLEALLEGTCPQSSPPPLSPHLLPGPLFKLINASLKPETFVPIMSKTIFLSCRQHLMYFGKLLTSR